MAAFLQSLANKRFQNFVGYLALLALLVSGCASSRHREGNNSKIGPTYIIYSPNGEPLNGSTLGRPTCREALSSWFDRLDAGHRGYLTHQEFMDDALTQFSRMDIDKNGYLLSEELERYRLPYRQDTNPVVANAGSGTKNDSTPKHRGNRHENMDDDNRSDTSSQSPEPDPVMSADTNNDFRVSLQEFKAQAEKLFAGYDTYHDGHVRLDAILKACKSPDTEEQ